MCELLYDSYETGAKIFWQEWIARDLDKGNGNVMGVYQKVSKCKLRQSMALWFTLIKDLLYHNSVPAAAIYREAPLLFAVIHTQIHINARTHQVNVHRGQHAIGNTRSYF